LDHPHLALPFHIAIKDLVLKNDTLLAATALGVFYVKANKWFWPTRATCLHTSDSGVYIGSLNGMYETGKNGNVFLGERNKLLSTRISAITKTKNGVYWIATYGDGIVGYKNDLVVMNIREEDGLTSNICRNLVVTGDTLWVGTDKGLNKICFSDQGFKITKFTMADGLSSDIIHAVYVDNGMVYVGTPQGLTYFDENRITRNSNCVLHFTAIKVSSNTWYDTTGFQLAPKDNNVRFEFAGISYRSGGDISYKYRLLGLDDNWKTTKESFLSYPSLPSGNYKLQLVAINKFGIQSSIQQVEFSIEEKLTEKTWFRILFVEALVFLTALFVILYAKRIRRKEKEKTNTLRRMAELEQMALRAQMNPHFIFNSLNSIQHYVIDKDIAGANKFITDFSSLIRQTLEFSTKQEVSVAEELSYLTTYLSLEKARMENKFHYEIIVNDNLSTQDHFIPPMILQPFVENSVRHGIGFRKDELGKISITINLKDQMLVCVVEDNGVGRQLAGQYRKAMVANHHSKGTSVTMARINMLNLNNENKIQVQIDDLVDASGKPAGTKVTLCFPVFNYATKSIV
ncbi:MAG: histidine kinase, partial [Flavisolibacter sp.]